MRYIIEKNGIKSFIDVHNEFVLEEQRLARGFIVHGLESSLPVMASSMSSDELKENQIKSAYDSMNADIYAQMNVVFGTSNADSAVAYERTWSMMQATPSNWVNAGLKAKFAIAGLAVGDALDTVQKVQDYANAKMAEVKAYGISRMQRIEQFHTERAAILAG